MFYLLSINTVRDVKVKTTKQPKMHFLKVLYTFCACAIYLLEVNSQAMYQPNAQHPDHPGFCYYSDLYGNGEHKFLLKPGQRRKHPTLCFEVNCSEDFGLSTVGCGLAASFGHCEFILGDKSKPYPYCCGELVC